MLLRGWVGQAWPKLCIRPSERGREGAGEGERAGASRAFSWWGRLSRGRRNVAPGPGLTPAELALAAILGVHEAEVVTESHGSL